MRPGGAGFDGAGHVGKQDKGVVDETRGSQIQVGDDDGGELRGNLTVMVKRRFQRRE